jgi:hypothetical protein
VNLTDTGNQILEYLVIVLQAVWICSAEKKRWGWSSSVAVKASQRDTEHLELNPRGYVGFSQAREGRRSVPGKGLFR